MKQGGKKENEQPEGSDDPSGCYYSEFRLLQNRKLTNHKPKQPRHPAMLIVVQLQVISDACE